MPYLASSLGMNLALCSSSLDIIHILLDDIRKNMTIESEEQACTFYNGLPLLLWV